MVAPGDKNIPPVPPQTTEVLCRMLSGTRSMSFVRGLWQTPLRCDME